MTKSSVPFAGRRITFIDLLRAFAILMMLQGHFTDTLLDVSYRNPDSQIYSTWLFMRGMTAPIFFFASGLIFVFLLMRDDRPFWDNVRVKKGLRRGAELILIGYVLRLSFPRLLTFDIYQGMFAVDVLHCIGLALWSLIAVYGLSRYLKLSYPLLLLLGGTLVFYYHFDFKNADWSFLPLVLENYLSQANGSVFTPVPWVGYAMLGGVLGYALNRRPQWAFGQLLPLALLFSGILVHYHSSWGLEQLYGITGFQAFLEHANFNFLLWRLGHVFVAVAIFIWIAQLWENIPKLLLRIGSETLVIYEVHFVLLYSTWFGIGLSTFWYRSLNPAQVFIGALFFEAFFFLLIAHIDTIRQYRWPWWKEKIVLFSQLAFQYSKAALLWAKGWVIYLWRVSRVAVVRWYHRLAYG